MLPAEESAAPIQDAANNASKPSVLWVTFVIPELIIEIRAGTMDPTCVGLSLETVTPFVFVHQILCFYGLQTHDF